MKAFLIINPNSGPKSTIKELDSAVEILKKNGIAVNKYISNSSSEAKRLSKKAVEEKMDLVIIAGGDGTINEVANILVNTTLLIAIIPTGTANVFAKEIGIPTGNLLKSDYINKCIEIIINKNIKTIDVGKVRFKNNYSKYFVMWCGIGLDAKLTKAKKSPPENLLGRFINYLIWSVNIAKLTLGFSGTQVKYKFDDNFKIEKLAQLLVSNGSIYANYFKISDKAKLDDEYLDLITILYKNKFSLLIFFIKLLINKNLGSNFHTQIKKIKIESEKSLPVHVDAETIGTTPVEIEIIPKALNVITAK